jgi:hypothetical protein
MVNSSPSGSSAAHSALNVSPWRRHVSISCSRLHTSRVNGSFRAMMRRISASIAGRSSSVKGRSFGAKS